MSSARQSSRRGIFSFLQREGSSSRRVAGGDAPASEGADPHDVSDMSDMSDKFKSSGDLPTFLVDSAQSVHAKAIAAHLGRGQGMVRNFL